MSFNNSSNRPVDALTAAGQKSEKRPRQPGVARAGFRPDVRIGVSRGGVFIHHLFQGQYTDLPVWFWMLGLQAIDFMARLARVVIPNTPHHVTQSGNRRQDVFFGDDDYVHYLSLIDEFAQKANTRVIAYCLMPNHVHFVLTPTHTDGLRAALGEAHRRYTRYINFRERWRGHLWQERFHSYPMDDSHLWAATRYVELNPVAAGIVSDPLDWPWSSARAHLTDQKDPHIKLARKPSLTADWPAYLASGLPQSDWEWVEQHLRTGRPLASDKFIAKAERTLNRTLRRQKPGPKPE